jgi:5-methylcytosine-specific restriction protein A
MIKNGKEVYRDDCSCSYCEHHRHIFDIFERLQEENKKKRAKKNKKNKKKQDSNSFVQTSSIKSRMRQEARVKMENISDCEDCGAPKQCVHHIIPLSEGGTNDRHNLKALCTSCHRQYHPELSDYLFS